MNKNKRETFHNRLGFIIVSASCAIGLGNIWLMPARVGAFGGALYILLVSIFLIIFAVPILLTEFAVGRASKQSTAKAFHILSPKSKWVLNGTLGIIGNYVLLMFYIMIVGFTFAYMLKGITGSLIGLEPADINRSWEFLVSSPSESFFWMLITIVLGISITFLGLKKGIERFNKYMMLIFFILIIILLFRSVTLPGATDGIRFLLTPNLDAILDYGAFKVIHMAMAQALFSLSVGIGSMAIFGSYMNRERRLFKDAFIVGTLDLSIIILALLMIFPAAFSFGIRPAIGEPLLFITMPNIFNEMPSPYLWSLLFFIALAFVAFSTAVAIIENLVAIGMDKFGWSRKKSSLINLFLLIILCTPSAFARNIWSVHTIPGFPHLGAFFTFLAMEIILPIGALLYILYCTNKKGWGWTNFFKEINTGSKGWTFPASLRFYMTYIMPLAIIFIFIFGQIQRWTP